MCSPEVIFTACIRRMREGNSFSLLVCPPGWKGDTYPPGQGTCPPPPSQGAYPSRSGWGRGTPRYLPPIQVRMGEGYPKVPTPLAKVPTPHQVRTGGGTPRYLPTPLPSQGTYPPGQVRTGGYPEGEVVPRSGWGRGTPRYLPPGQGTYPHQVRTAGYPKVPTYPPSPTKVPTPWPSQDGVPQGTYLPPPRPRYLPPWPRYLPPPPPGQDGGGGTPRYLPH